MKLAGPVDLAHSLHGGQAFRWVEREGVFEGPMGKTIARLRQRDGWAFEADGADRAGLRSYFRLERADAARRERLLRDPLLSTAMRALPGLRLLRQDPWETTVAFLASANNNVLRIEGIVRAIASRFGDALGAGSGDVVPSAHLTAPVVHFAFPSAARLARAREGELRACGLGYRAPFLRASARSIASGDVALDELRGRPREEVREALLQLDGVGPKVADCIALFSLDVDDAFPMDRWMLRAMSEAFGRPMKNEEAADLARERWGRDAGLAQQYLFHAMRMRERAPGTARVAGSSR